MLEICWQTLLLCWPRYKVVNWPTFYAPKGGVSRQKMPLLGCFKCFCLKRSVADWLLTIRPWRQVYVLLLKFSLCICWLIKIYRPCAGGKGNVQSEHTNYQTGLQSLTEMMCPKNNSLCYKSHLESQLFISLYCIAKNVIKKK